MKEVTKLLTELGIDFKQVSNIMVQVTDKNFITKKEFYQIISLAYKENLQIELILGVLQIHGF